MLEVTGSNPVRSTICIQSLGIKAFFVFGVETRKNLPEITFFGAETISCIFINLQQAGGRNLFHVIKCH